MRIKANISLKLTAFLLAISVLPFLLYQILTFSMVRTTIVEMAAKQSMELLVHQEVHLAQQIKHIEDLLNNIDSLNEIKQTLEYSNQKVSASDDFEVLSTQMHISSILGGYSSLTGLVSIDLFSNSGRHYHVGDTLNNLSIDAALRDQLIAESNPSDDKIRWHGIQKNVNLSSDRQQVILASKTLRKFEGDEVGYKPLATLLVSYDPISLYQHLDQLNSSTLMVIDNSRRLLYHQDHSLIGKMASTSLTNLLASNEGKLKIDMAGSPTLLIYRKIPELGWYVVSMVPEKVLLAPVQGIVQTGAWLLAGLILLLLFPWRLFDQQVIRPLRSLSEGFRNFQSRRLPPEWRMPPMKALSEIKELANWFNVFLETMEVRRQAEADLRIAAISFEAQEGMVISDTATRILRVNRAFNRITGYEQDEVVGKPAATLKSGAHDASFYNAIWDSLTAAGQWSGEATSRRKNGELYASWLTITTVRDSANEVTNYVGTIVDLSSLKKAEQEVERLAYYDPLTNLPNRRLLLERLKQATAVSGRQKQTGAVLFIDLDNFKYINDSQGHEKGDRLLKEAALRLRRNIKETETVARVSGDEFVVILENLGQDAAAEELARIAGEKLLVCLQAPYELDRQLHICTASIGVALFTQADQSIEETIKQADLAMYEAKLAGRNALRFFSHDMQSAVNERAQMETSLHQAIVDNQLELHYQVQVNGKDGALGAEALLRWNHPEKGMIGPGVFIPIAEQSDLILHMGNWVLETACRQLAQWASDPQRSQLTLAVNVSARQFHQPEFVAQVLRTLAITQAPPQRLKLELTESLLLGDVREAIHKMHQLKQHGVSFSLDDFGTGYSSLSYLKRLPLDQLKIDRSFVQDLMTNHHDAAIVRTILALASTLGLNVIAEGVETEDQKTRLFELGCHDFQGYLFSRPVALAEFEKLLQRMGPVIKLSADPSPEDSAQEAV